MQNARGKNLYESFEELREKLVHLEESVAGYKITKISMVRLQRTEIPG